MPRDPILKNFTPRASQAQVLAYTGGKMGVAAVPGAGKTRTLSALAAKLIISGRVRDDQEVLVVTLVNAAVDNFAQRVRELLEGAGLLGNFGYRVRTLHGLCSDIVRERPDLVALQEGFAILDEREADGILQDAARSYVRLHPETAEAYLKADLKDQQRERVLAQDWETHAVEIARAFVKLAKDERLLPDELATRLAGHHTALPLAEMCIQIYSDYQRGLNYRGAVDFQDLIRLALDALETDETFLKRLREHFPYVLEDEAQDSSKLQEQLLRLLVGEQGNWVRVGDPNQAIYETFTTARPEFLWNFLAEPGVQARELPESGRSAAPILDLANQLMRWTLSAHPVAEIQARAPLRPPEITPTPPNDPQPNPPAEQARITIHADKLTVDGERDLVIKSLARWLPAHPDQTCAILVPRNKRGFDLVDAIKQHRDPKFDYMELLRSTTTTRETAGALTHLLRYLAQPTQPNLLARAFEVWRRDDREDEAAAQRVIEIVKLLRRLPRVEDYVWSQLGRDWLRDDPDLQALFEQDSESRDLLHEFRAVIRRWQGAVVLPIDQLLLIFAQDLFTNSADLAIAHSLAVALRQKADTYPAWRYPNYIEALTEIARNERRFLGMDADARGFEPKPGTVTVATIHTAKGLEWDRVYLLSLNDYDFPAGYPSDRFISEKWFVRDGLNLQAEALAQLHAAAEPAAYDYTEGVATHDARMDYAAERLRLLYVAITRARRELIMTWNSGRRGEQQPSAAFLALGAYVDEQAR